MPHFLDIGEHNFQVGREELNMNKRPHGELATRPLHFIWICDCSDSMAKNGKIKALNTAIREAIPHMQEVAEENPNAEVLVRAIKFSSGAQWHIEKPIPVADFKWTDLKTAGGGSDMGEALSMVADQLKMPPMANRGLPPVLVLISDGLPTDDFSSGLKALMSQPWGRKSVRIAIAISEDANPDVLQKFISYPELKPLQANNIKTLFKYIFWGPPSPPKPNLPKDSSSPVLNVPIPVPPDIDDTNDVW
jgi:uncharacterized protein YegL